MMDYFSLGSCSGSYWLSSWEDIQPPRRQASEHVCEGVSRLGGKTHLNLCGAIPWALVSGHGKGSWSLALIAPCLLLVCKGDRLPRVPAIRPPLKWWAASSDSVSPSFRMLFSSSVLLQWWHKGASGTLHALSLPVDSKLFGGSARVAQDIWTSTDVHQGWPTEWR